MRNDPVITEIKNKLERLTNFLIEEAKQNEMFREKLANTLEIKLAVKKPTNKKIPDYDLFAKFEEFGRNYDLLKEDLMKQEISELKLIGTSKRIGTKKELEKFSQGDLADRLVEHIKKELGLWGNPEN